MKLGREINIWNMANVLISSKNFDNIDMVFVVVANKEDGNSDCFEWVKNGIFSPK